MNDPGPAPDGNIGNDTAVFTGVPTTPEDLYGIMLFFLALVLMGDCVCQRLLKIVPSLVGYILVGIAFGPEGFGVLGSNTEETLAVLGNLGLVLLIAQAGLEMDYATLRLVGLRGVAVAVVGTILPVSIGTAVASRYLGSWRSALSAGCSFGPTSAGIAMNVLGQCTVRPARSGGGLSSPGCGSNEDDDGGSDNGDTDSGSVLRLPVGQLIVAAAIVDDILALVVLSQLQALTTTTTDAAGSDGGTNNNIAMDVALPIASAVLWLVVGGGIALWVFPRVLSTIFDRVAKGRPSVEGARESGGLSLGVLFGLLYALLPATYLTGASHLLGGFLSGLAFCRDPTGVASLFRSRFGRLVEWLMKLFFAASIGFQVPVRSFGDTEVVSRGCFFSLALLGKLAVGLMTPTNLDPSGERTSSSDSNDGNDDNGHPDTASPNARSFCRGKHARDCFVVGFSMMGEAEFAFVVAVFGVTEGLVPPDIYASIVFAILLSTVISPLLLKTTLAFFPYDYDYEQHDSQSVQREDSEPAIKGAKAAIEAE